MYKYDTWPPILENTTDIRYRFAFLSCSVCFFISQPRVSGPKTEHESFFVRSLISCMRLVNMRETKKASPKHGYAPLLATFRHYELRRSLVVLNLKLMNHAGNILRNSNLLLKFRYFKNTLFALTPPVEAQ